MSLDLKHLYLCSLDLNGKIISKRKLTSVPLKDEIIISKSIEFFNDAEPCMIHRSAVMARLYSEIGNYIIKAIEKELSLESLPEELKSYIDNKVDLNSKFIKVKNK